MKYIVFLIVFTCALSCSIFKSPEDLNHSQQPTPTPSKETVVSWEVGHAERAPWTQYLFKVIKENKSDLFLAQDVFMFCPKFSVLDEEKKVFAFAQIFSEIARHESNWSPVSRYTETTMGKDCITNKQVVSEGLFQLSYCDKTWQPKCAFDWEKDKKLSETDPRKSILDAYINTECAVSIMAQQVKSKKKIVLSSNVYWAVLKDGGRYEKIDEIRNAVSALPFCQ